MTSTQKGSILSSYLSLRIFTLTNTSIKRIGFACKFSELNHKGEVSSVPEMTTGGTTLAWATRNKRAIAEERVFDIAKRNILNTHNLVKKIGSLDPELRMVRLTSDMLSFYTHKDWQPFWQSTDIQKMLAAWFAPIGETARANDVRLSFHPGQFTVLASSREEVVNKSIEEFEYHADMVRWLGYGKTFQDFKINVHISGREGPTGIKAALQRLSPEARNCITIENDELTWGIDSSLELAHDLALVLDVHHHWVHTGEYIEASDDRIKRIVDSWRGKRPTMHYSVSREDVLGTFPGDQRPDLATLLASGHKKQKLRAHSNYLWSDAVNDWALSHWDWADIMVEAKSKNLGSRQLYDRYTKNQGKINA